jgi:hypothetical protein
VDVLTQFLTYAGEFEKSYKDDDWSRVEPYFCADAVYRVVGLGVDCEIRGPKAIFRGIKKSLDGFDRRFDARRIDIVAGPEVAGDELRIGWTVTYTKAQLEPFVLRGRTEVRGFDGKIASMADHYDDAMAAEAARWAAANSFPIDPSYV